MIGPNQPDDIRRQMVALRSLLRQDARSLAADASRLADWRFHFRAHPMVWCASATALGFMLVPRRAKRLPEQTTGEPSTASSQHLAGAVRPSVISVLANVATAALARGAVAYVQRTIERLPNAMAARQPTGSHQVDLENSP